MQDGIVTLAAVAVGMREVARAARSLRSFVGGGTPRHPGRWGCRARAKRARRLERAAERRERLSLADVKRWRRCRQRQREIHEETWRAIVVADRAAITAATVPLLPDGVTIGWDDGRQG